MKAIAQVEPIEGRTLFASSFSAAINFAPLDAPRAPGMLTDYGSTYDVRRGGLSYGWTKDETASAVDRNFTKVQRNDTFIGMRGGATWEIGVANGTYRVFVVAGDPAKARTRMALSVEGTLALAGKTYPSIRYLEGDVTVNVTDGKLTVASAGEFGQDKINYLAIESVAPSTPTTTHSLNINWTNGPKELVARVEPESAVVNNLLYVFSGYGDIAGTGGDGWQPSPTFDVYNPDTNSWARGGTMPIATTHSAVAVVGTDIWFAGGYTARAGTTDKQDIGTTNVWVYHTVTNKWDKGPALPQARASGGMALVGGKLYFVAGEPLDHHSDPTNVWALDLSHQSAGWVSKAPIPQGRTHFGIAVVGDKIYVIGGQLDIDENATFLKTAYAYDTTANSWTRIADLPSIRSHLSPNTIVVDGKIMSFGGEYKFNFDMAEVIQYDPDTNEFQELTPLPAGRAAGSAAYLNGKLIFTGGKNNGFFSDTWIGTFV